MSGSASDDFLSGSMGLRPDGGNETVSPSPDLSDADLKARLRDLPASARSVYEQLVTNGPLTHKELLAATEMPGRTVRYAVSRLKDAGVIGARCNLMDCRQCYFFVIGACPGQGKSPFMKTSFRAS